MPNDSFTIRAAINEIKSLISGGKINRVNQPETDEINLSVYANGKVLHLLLSASANYPRIHLTSALKENPALPYNFCMTLRKHLQGGEITGIKTLPYERVVIFDIENSTELKDRSLKKLIIEIMGRQSNIILCDEDFKIISALKSVPIDENTKRSVLPGIKYVCPENNRIKINDLNAVKKQLETFSGGDLAGFITGSFAGFSKAAAEHIILCAQINKERLSPYDTEKLITAFSDFDQKIYSGEYKPCIMYSGGLPSDFFPFPYLGTENLVFYNTVNECEDVFYGLKDKGKRLTEKKKNIMSALKNASAKAEKKIVLLNDKLEECKNAGYFKQCGELITAYIYTIRGGEKDMTVNNYIDGTGGEITIALDGNLSPAKNAQRYFKKYTKLKTAEKIAKEQLKESSELLCYLNGVSGFLDSSENLTDISEIENELIQQGVLRREKAPRTLKKKDSAPNIFITDIYGCRLYAGKNNIQNDYVTYKIAKPGDLWFHIKDYHGCHAVLSSPDKKYPAEAILAAAKFAVKFSGRENKGKTAVDYTYKKFVKKTSGAKPGFAVYTDYKTVIVE